ncbi:hypothetical protein VPH35_049033 [Triticum aestivum]
MNPLASCSPDENFSGFPAHPSIPFNPELVYCCASATLQAATVDAAASSKAHCHHRASQVHLLAAVSAIAETNQELVASKHQGWSQLKQGTSPRASIAGRTWAPQVIYLEDEHSTRLFVVNNFGDAHDRQ